MEEETEEDGGRTEPRETRKMHRALIQENGARSSVYVCVHASIKCGTLVATPDRRFEKDTEKGMEKSKKAEQPVGRTPPLDSHSTVFSRLCCFRVFPLASSPPVE